MHDPIAAALAEDIGPGDITAEFFIAASSQSEARIFVKEPAVLAGIGTAAEVFRRVDAALEIKTVLSDGARLLPGDTVLRISGATRAIVTAERVALNFLQRLSGVATLTQRYVEAIAGTRARLLDTRKTTPGLRLLEKAAVIAGGGTNHRLGLYDRAMVKDNHLLADDQLAHLQAAIDLLKIAHPQASVELEADRLEQVAAFLTLRGVEFILLDNMNLEELRNAVKLTNGRVFLEASGGVNLDTVAHIAATGVDYISVGAITHSARAIDFSLELT